MDIFLYSFHGFYNKYFFKNSIEINESMLSRENNLDGFRYFLASFVAFHHSYLSINFFKYGEWSHTISFENYIGGFGVAVFFIISGYLFAEIPFKKNNWKDFYIKRFFRIAPMAYISSLICIIISIILFGITDFIKLLFWLDAGLFNFRPNFNNFHFSSSINAGVTWSLQWEWLFYFSLPLLSILFKKDNIKNTIIYLIIFLILTYILIYFKKPSYIQIILFSWYFTIGFISKKIIKARISNKIRIKKTNLNIISLALLMACFLIGSNTDHFFILKIKYLLPILYALLFFSIVLGANWFGLLTNYGFRLLGDASYSIYLIHGIFWFLLNTACYSLKIFNNSILYYILSFFTWTFICLCSIFFYRRIELPFINYSKNLTKK